MKRVNDQDGRLAKKAIIDQFEQNDRLSDGEFPSVQGIAREEEKVRS